MTRDARTGCLAEVGPEVDAFGTVGRLERGDTQPCRSPQLGGLGLR